MRNKRSIKMDSEEEARELLKEEARDRLDCCIFDYVYEGTTKEALEAELREAFDQDMLESIIDGVIESDREIADLEREQRENDRRRQLKQTLTEVFESELASKVDEMFAAKQQKASEPATISRVDAHES